MCQNIFFQRLTKVGVLNYICLTFAVCATDFDFTAGSQISPPKPKPRSSVITTKDYQAGQVEESSSHHTADTKPPPPAVAPVARVEDKPKKSRPSLPPPPSRPSRPPPPSVSRPQRPPGVANATSSSPINEQDGSGWLNSFWAYATICMYVPSVTRSYANVSVILFAMLGVINERVCSKVHS